MRTSISTAFRGPKLTLMLQGEFPASRTCLPRLGIEVELRNIQNITNAAKTSVQAIIVTKTLK